MIPVGLFPENHDCVAHLYFGTVEQIHFVVGTYGNTVDTKTVFGIFGFQGTSIVTDSCDYCMMTAHIHIACGYLNVGRGGLSLAPYHHHVFLQEMFCAIIIKIWA